jgi:hypothetical protein
MRIGPRSPAVKEFWLSATGIPLAVVNVLSSILIDFGLGRSKKVSAIEIAFFDRELEYATLVIRVPVQAITLTQVHWRRRKFAISIKNTIA